MRFITFNAIKNAEHFKLVVPVNDIVYGFSYKETSTYYIMVKGREYAGLGDILSINDNVVTRIDLMDDKGIEKLSTISW